MNILRSRRLWVVDDLIPCCISLIFLFSFSITALAAEKGQEQQSSLPREHVQKLKRIAEIVAGEMTGRGIKTVAVEDFTDFKGNPSAKGKVMAREFRKELASMSRTNFSVVDKGAEAIVTGILIPFKESGKWKLDIKAVSADKGRIITSYTGIFKKPKRAKK